MPDLHKQKKKTTEIAKKVGNKALDLQANSSRHVNQYLTKRVGRVKDVRRFIVGWMLLVIGLLAATAFTTWQLRQASVESTPQLGGSFSEGMVGTINTLNPLFGSGVLDESVAKLLFNGVMRYDTEGKLVPDIAEAISTDESGKVYTIQLRRDVRWHDGQPLTAKDVVYTIQAIQNPATRSTRFSSWQGITVTAPSDYTVRYELPAPFAPFPGALTLPILPAHLLANIPADQLRTASFSTSPVGSGPFVFSALRNQVRTQHLELASNKSYHRNRPKLDRFVLHTYENSDSLVNALKSNEITAAVDIKAEAIRSLKSDATIKIRDIPLYNGVFGFFKTTSPKLSDPSVRRALALAVDRQVILDEFGGRYGVLKTPLVPGQLGYDSTYKQRTNPAEAVSLLEQAGWKRGDDGVRTKDGAPLTLSLVTTTNSEYSALADKLQKQWAAIGVKIEQQLLTADQLQQTALTAHSYDILLYGISIGQDPDVYAYWHSSQTRAGGLNFSEWNSSRADASLDVARTRLEPVLRTARYKTFLDEWQQLAPAVALYQPRTSYLYHQNANGFVPFLANSAAERLTNVEDWTVSTKKVLKTR